MPVKVPDPPAEGPYPVATVCANVQAWAAQATNVDAIYDYKNKLAAIDTYLQRTSTEGRREVAIAMRTLEVRIGQLLPMEQGKRADLLPNRGEEVSISSQEKAQFRTMAAHPEVVQDVIDQSTDEHPASRRAVLQTIRGEVRAMPDGYRRSPQSSNDTRLGKCADGIASMVVTMEILAWETEDSILRDRLVRDLGNARAAISKSIKSLKEHGEQG